MINWIYRKLNKKRALRGLHEQYSHYVMYSKICEHRLNKAYGCYNRKPKCRDGEVPTIIYMCSTKSGASGGLTDRLRGMASLHGLCKSNGWKFKIYFNTPFMLQDYLVPADYDWTIPEEDISYKDSLPLFCMDYGKRTSEFGLRYINEKMDRGYKVVHVYTNICFSWEHLSASFHELFRPGPELEHLIELNTTQIDGPYISVVFRFQQLLGDFYEGDRSKILSEPEREELICKCLAEIADIRDKNKEFQKVLVTSDSVTFLERASKAFDYVYTIPGDVVHVDFTNDAHKLTYMKSFVDFFMLSRSDKVYLVVGQGMYKSGFAFTAALLNNVPYCVIDCK